ncbi:four helix bundle protein [Rubritalea spongiae]|uniref:Four helix bundle protein n=1 Tax=Rubritalea spongiae TaxID=430797 RepID=A0ABW5E0V8_9BACT
MAHNFQNLEIWKRGCVLTEKTYAAFKGSTEYELKSQMVRSALSIPSNIAEAIGKEE